MVDRVRATKRPKFGGRVKGTPNKTTIAREKAIKLAGVTPLEFLLNGVTFYQRELAALADKLIKARRNVTRAEGKKQREDAQNELHALQLQEAKYYGLGREYAKDAAPYCHNRLATVEHTGREGGPIEVTAIKRTIIRSGQQK